MAYSAVGGLLPFGKYIEAMLLEVFKILGRLETDYLRIGTSQYDIHIWILSVVFQIVISMNYESFRL